MLRLVSGGQHSSLDSITLKSTYDIVAFLSSSTNSWTSAAPNECERTTILAGPLPPPIQLRLRKKFAIWPILISSDLIAAGRRIVLKVWFCASSKRRPARSCCPSPAVLWCVDGLRQWSCRVRSPVCSSRLRVNSPGGVRVRRRRCCGYQSRVDSDGA